jgi:hypothetical protein
MHRYDPDLRRRYFYLLALLTKNGRFSGVVTMIEDDDVSL